MNNGINDTQMAWIGSLPNDWECKSLRTLTYFINDSNADMRFTNILSLLKDIGVVPYEEKGNQGNKSKEDLSNYKIAYKNTIVINSMNLKIGSVGLSKYDGCVSPVYYVLGIRKGNSIDYVNYLFQTRAFQEYLGSFGRGIMEIREKISKDDMKTALIPKPPLATQNRIVAYLDKQIAIIDRQIEANKKAVELLGEYRVSEISRIATKGLNENVELKDSGNEFLGQIPKHWELLKIRFFATMDKSGIDKNQTANEIPVKLIQYTNIYKRREQHISDNDFLDITANENEKKRGQVHKGDILMTFSSETADDIGHSTVIMEEMPDYMFGSDILRIKTDKIILGYKKYLIEHTVYFRWFESLCRGTTRFRFSLDDFKNILFAIPPIAEQKEIVAYLDKRCKQIDKIIAYRKSIIEKLEEYKKSLIYEAVTGKKEI